MTKGSDRVASPHHHADIAISELASFAYCAKAWHLEKVVGVSAMPAVRRNRDAGVAHHVAHDRQARSAIQVSRRIRVLPFVLILIAVALFAAAIAAG